MNQQIYNCMRVLHNRIYYYDTPRCINNEVSEPKSYKIYSFEMRRIIKLRSRL